MLPSSLTATVVPLGNFSKNKEEGKNFLFIFAINLSQGRWAVYVCVWISGMFTAVYYILCTAFYVKLPHFKMEFLILFIQVFFVLLYYFIKFTRGFTSLWTSWLGARVLGGFLYYLDNLENGVTWCFLL